MTEVDQTVCIDATADIAEDVVVGPFCYVGPDVHIGSGCRLDPHVTILGNTQIGAGCHLHSGAVIGDTPQDAGFDGAPSYVHIGNECIIREGVTIHRGTGAETVTRVGDGCFLMAFAHLAHNVTLGRRVILANGALLGGHVTVGDGAFISGNAVVHQFVHIGRLAMLGGGAGASKDVPPFMTLRPIALNTIAGLNTVGLRRAGIDGEGRKQIKRAFSMLYRSEKNVSQAVALMREAFPEGVGSEIWKFVEDSTRGICAPETGSSGSE